MMMQPDRIEHRPLARLKPYALNAKTRDADQVAKIAASMAEFGWTVPCLVAAVASPMQGQHARLMFTSPPYAKQRDYGAAKEINGATLSPARIVTTGNGCSSSGCAGKRGGRKQPCITAQAARSPSPSIRRPKCWHAVSGVLRLCPPTRTRSAFTSRRSIRQLA